MRSHNNPHFCRLFLALLMASMLCLPSLGGTVRAQSGGTVDTGVNIPVRTNEEINTTKSDGRGTDSPQSERRRLRTGS
jgi:hypothetical protein